MDLLAAFRTYVRVVEAGSFTAAASEFNTTQPTISRQVAALEDFLGARLLTRTTRALSLTDDGRRVFERAQAVIEAADDAVNAVGRRRGKPSGLLRMAMSVGFGRRHVLPIIKDFMDTYPDVEIEAVMHDGHTNLVEEGVDLALRVGPVGEQGLIAKRVGTVHRVTVATPGYVEEHGEPEHPRDLVNHQCIVFTRMLTPGRFTFTTPEGPLEVQTHGRFRVDSTEGYREGVLQGLGIAVIPAWAFDEELEDGTLKVLLPGFESDPLPVHAVYPSKRFLAPKVRAMIDFLAAEFNLNPRLSSYGL